VVIVSGGTYLENLLIETGITLKSADATDPAIIDGSSPETDPALWNGGSCIVIRTPSGASSRVTATVQDITMTGGKGTDIIEDSNHNGSFSDPEDIEKKVGGGMIIHNAGLLSKRNKIINNGEVSTKEGGAVYAAGTGADIPDDNPEDPPDDHFPNERILIEFEDTIFSGNDAQIGHTVMVNGWDPENRFIDIDFGNSHFDCVFDSVDNTLDGVSEYWVKGKDNSSFDFSGGITGEIPAITTDVWIDPVNGVDEDNLTGNEGNPFLTINYALSMVYPTEENPVTIHLIEDIYSSTTENFPIVLISNVNIVGLGEDVSILDANQTNGVIVIDNCNNISISNLTITGGCCNDFGPDGGISLINSNIILTHVIISDNIGGGMYLEYSHPTLTDVIISENSGRPGMRIYSSHPTLTDVIISENSGGDTAGGIDINNSNPILNRVLISGNTSNFSSAMYICCNSNPNLTHVTISNNISPQWVSIFLASNSQLTMINSIIWHDSQEEILLSENTAGTNITYTNIQGGWEGEENIDVDPLFADFENGDYRLSWDNYPYEDETMSPCIDAGTADLNGNGYEDITDSLYYGQAPDMGAYEFDSEDESCESGIYDYCGICDGENIQLYECWDGLCVENVEDCEDQGCTDGYVEDCSGDGDCCPESWIGDGFVDCEDQAFGCDLTCYDNDGGDCDGRTDNNKSEDVKLIKKKVQIREERMIPGYFSYSDVRNHCPIIGTDVGCDGICFSGMEYDECDVCGGDGSSCGLAGDLNGDGMLNILDVVMLVNIVLGYGDPLPSGDLNGDGVLNILDVVALIYIILGG